MDIPYDLNGIQPRATWVWNCGKIGFDPNGRWNRAIFTYNFLPGERMRKVKTVERPPFWCTWLVSTWENGRCFIPPIILHQTKEYFEDLHFKIPLDWTVHHTPSGYMDRDGWIKSKTQFSNVCGASPINNQIIFFDGHNNHFDDSALIHTEHRNL